MNKAITIILIIFSLLIGYMIGTPTEKEIQNITTSESGVQIYYTDGTGYWYEY